MPKILVIEDEEDIRLGILKALDYQGFEALGAENGRIGVQLAREQRPELIICDILMPELSGYGVLVKLRRTPQTAAIPFVFLTAKTGKDHVRQGIRLGADAYLTKPFHLEELLGVVNSLLLRKDTDSAKPLDAFRVNLARTLPAGLQAPLTGIIGFAGLLAELGTDLLPSATEIIEMQAAIYENALRLQRQMTDHLLYAELELLKADPARQTRWQRAPLRTKELIASFASHKAAAANRQADLVFELVEATVPMFPGSLKKLVEELLEQAFLFSAPGTPVQIVTTMVDQRFTLTITDRGRRMVENESADDEARTLLEDVPYEHQGAWLGVNICRLLVQLHGGEFTLNNAPPQGTTVTIVINQPN